LEIGAGRDTDRSQLWVVSSREPLFRETVFFLEYGLHVRVRIAQPFRELLEALTQAFLPQPANRVVDRARRSAGLDRLVGDRELSQEQRLARFEPARELLDLDRGIRA